ncbi:DsbA family protein [Desulfococcus sp.]|uniref:DsbA family protein n=1 Tax=Desulfococcus sp. TaxID=2025834 RepID=UPI003593FF55
MIRNQLKTIRFLAVLAAAGGLACISPAAVHAGVVFEHLLKIDSPARILDTAASPDGRMIFTLTPGEVIIYSGTDGKEIDRIAVEKRFTRLTPLEESRLILFGDDPPGLDILKVDRIYDINTANRPFRGDENAKAVIAVFDDYECPYCSRLESRFDMLVKEYAGQVKLVIKHFPIPSHRNAYPAAMAALAAANQEKFWEFHAALLQNHAALDDQKIREIADSLKLDRERFEKDLSSPQSHERILQDMQEGQEMDVRGTPTVFLNGKKLDNREFRKLPDMINEILAKEKPAAAVPKDTP